MGITWANLSYLYAVTGRSTTGFNACYKTDSLQPGLPCVNNNFGLLNENKGNLSFMQRNITIDRSTSIPGITCLLKAGLPVPLFGQVCALADSFFYEAEKRRWG